MTFGYLASLGVYTTAICINLSTTKLKLDYLLLFLIPCQFPPPHNTVLPVFLSNLQPEWVIILLVMGKFLRVNICVRCVCVTDSYCMCVSCMKMTCHRLHVRLTLVCVVEFHGNPNQRCVLIRTSNDHNLRRTPNNMLHHSATQLNLLTLQPT